MSTPETEQQVVYLTPAAKKWSLTLGFMFVIWAGILIACPHRKITIETDSCGCQKTKTEEQDQAGMIAALLTAGVGMLLFSLNGLCMASFSVGTFKFAAATQARVNKEDLASSAAQLKEALPDREASSTQPPQQSAHVGVKGGKVFKELHEFGPGARKVLRTLIRFQRQIPSSSNQRWGFAVNPSASDYFEFRAGVAELMVDGIVIVDRRGLVFLSETGMRFCDEQNIKNGLAGGGSFWTEESGWSEFSPAEP